MRLRLPCRLPGGSCTTDSWPRSTTTSTSRAPWRACARCSGPDLPADERRWLVLDADAVLGLDLHRVWEARPEEAGEADVPTRDHGLVAARDEARTARDYARADELRRELAERGWDVVDGPGGSELRRR